MPEAKIRSDALLLLELEHERLGRVLTVIDEALHAMAEGRSFDIDLVHQALLYLLDYPDRCHHPKEDLIAKRIGDRLGSAEAVDLQGDHEDLHALTAQVLEQFDAARHDRSSGFDAPLREFVAAYRQHIGHENAVFFPLALRTLSQDDFDEIDFKIFDAPDPVFDQREEARFNTLRQVIVDAA